MNRLLLLVFCCVVLGCKSNVDPQMGSTAELKDSNQPSEDITSSSDSAESQTVDASVVSSDVEKSDSSSSSEDTAEADVQAVDAGGAIADTTAKDDATPPPPVKPEYTTFIGDWTMKPGKEVTRCAVKRLNNETAIWVKAISTKMFKGSHHLIVYKSNAKEEQAKPFNCSPFLETITGETVPLMISQVSEETLNFPEGVAIKLEPNQMIRMEAHYLNYYPEDITAHADVTFVTIPENEVEHEANLLFQGTPDFSLAPNKETKSAWHFAQVTKDTKIFAMTGHTHEHGTNVEIMYSKDKDDASNLVYPKDKPFNWAEAPVVVYDPPLSFDGTNGLRYQCTWFNTSNKKVTFGESANKEMCFFWAYYYPSTGYRLCVNPGKLKDMAPDGLVGDQECCPGSAVCGLLKQFLKDGVPDF